jgi:hypothetical protein
MNSKTNTTNHATPPNLPELIAFLLPAYCIAFTESRLPQDTALPLRLYSTALYPNSSFSGGKKQFSQTSRPSFFVLYGNRAPEVPQNISLSVTYPN